MVFAPSPSVPRLQTRRHTGGCCDIEVKDENAPVIST